MRGDKILLFRYEKNIQLKVWLTPIDAFFSQSLLTLDLIEEYLAKRIVSGTTETWRKNRNYFSNKTAILIQRMNSNAADIKDLMEAQVPLNVKSSFVDSIVNDQSVFSSFQQGKE